ncbi:MAG: succinylglutamate desuccinylase [Verrucomicrobia bacterium]|nr:succinylglutamate desuccinylase [Verrucomicrobiota bacterium]
MQLPHTTTIQGSSNGPHLLITAGIHGDEFEGIFAIYNLIRQIDAAKLHGKLTLIPVANQSAVDLHSRCGEDNKDLARTFPGDANGSLTEQLAAHLTEIISKADLYIDLHTGGRTMDVYPLSGYGLVKNATNLETQRRMARAMGLPLIWGTSPELNGRTMSAARDAGVPAIYAEYRGPCPCDPLGIEAYTNGCLAVMSAFDMLDNTRPLQPSQPPIIVEDPRPGSGHLQVCNPSPIKGIFEISAQLGQNVKPGDLLGTVIDPLTGKEHKITCNQTGVIIVIRSYPQVDEGDALAVILENCADPSSPYQLPSC